MRKVSWLLALGLMTGLGGLLTNLESAESNAPADSSNLAPVEPNMHEFMEYYFEPAYKALHTSMAEEPENNTGWKSIKANSLVLAEGGNLLLLHKPYKSDDVESWQKYSTAVRKHGGELFAAARKKDFATARKAYEAMIGQCNHCHDGFHHGKPMLKP